jgi:two-component system sensor histidine kinase KdpD
MDAANARDGYFLDLIRKSRKGKFKIYIGMCAGVGKTYRMLQESRKLLEEGIDITIGYVETHDRPDTSKLLEGLPQIPRRKLYYRGKELEEMDLQAILNKHPEVVIVDELAHSNIEGSRHEKRWQDVLDILEEGINVISAVNIQHLESLNQQVEMITGAQIRERIPDKLLQMADEVVNIDLTADELIERLNQGKIYDPKKVDLALKNFFRPDRLLRLREISLKEVASQLEHKIEQETPANAQLRPETFMVCISANADTARRLIRKTSRLANYYHSRWYLLYVQRKNEYGDKISLSVQRHLIDNFRLATELGAEVIRIRNEKVAMVIMETAREKGITTVCIGKPHLNLWQVIVNTNIFNHLLGRLSKSDIDLVILS